MMSLFFIAADAEIRGIRGLAGETFFEANAYWLIPTASVSVTGLVACIFLLGWRMGRKVQLTPREEALQELAAAAPLIDEGAPESDKRYSIAVSAALRGYLEKAHGLRAPEQTTEEFLQTARGDARIGEEALKSLGTFLRLCDLAKFARHAFGREERIQLLDTARTFIEQQEKPDLKLKQTQQEGELAEPVTANQETAVR